MKFKFALQPYEGHFTYRLLEWTMVLGNSTLNDLTYGWVSSLGYHLDEC